MVNTCSSAGPSNTGSSAPTTGSSTPATGSSAPATGPSASARPSAPVGPSTATTVNTAFPESYKSRKANWDNIDKLQGAKDYDDWSHQVALLLSALHLDKVVLDGIKPVTDEETIVYNNMVCDALYLLTQVVSKPIMRKIARTRDPHEIWTYLRTTYYRDNGFNFVWQLHSLFKIADKFNESSEKLTIESFVDEYEQQYDRIQNLVAASKYEEYNTTYKTFLDSDRAKKDYLLTALASRYPSVVDNIATKDLLRYEEVKDKLFSLHGFGLLAVNKKEKAMVTSTKKIDKRSRFNKDKNAFSTITCFYCQKGGHRRSECRKLKADKEKKKGNSVTGNGNTGRADTANSGPKQERALVVSSGIPFEVCSAIAESIR